jgi:hypothetical protein
MIASLGTLPGWWNTVNRMNAQHDHSDGEGAVAGPGEERVHVSRRRFARAGLSSSVVLGSLVSKPVLGQVAYRCTVSGQLSGNVSAPREPNATCNKGSSPTAWVNNTWPTSPMSATPALVKGELPKSNCKFDGGQNVKGTAFNGFVSASGAPALMAKFFYDESSTLCAVTTSDTTLTASLLQVLANPNGSGDIYELGRVTVASLLNAYTVANYPVTAKRISEMFNAVCNGGSYAVAGTNKSLTMQGVITYLKQWFA